MEDEPAPRRAIVSGPNLPGRRTFPPGGRDLLGRQCLGRPRALGPRPARLRILAPVSYACRPRRSRLPGGTWRMSRLPGGTSE